MLACSEVYLFDINFLLTFSMFYRCLDFFNGDFRRTIHRNIYYSHNYQASNDVRLTASKSENERKWEDFKFSKIVLHILFGAVYIYIYIYIYI